MIFVTVGNLDPFDRLIKTVDGWLESRGNDVDVFAQIANGRYKPRNCEYVNFVSPTEYQQRFHQSELVVSHAGMGTIITAMEYNKPIVIMPKLASLGEQRNEHQLATARHFRRSPRINVASDERQLIAHLEAVVRVQETNDLGPADQSREWSPDESLIQFVRQFVTLT